MKVNVKLNTRHCLDLIMKGICLSLVLNELRTLPVKFRFCQFYFQYVPVVFD